MFRSTNRTSAYLAASASALALSSYFALAKDASAPPAWAAEATMNADYVANAATAPAATAPAPAAQTGTDAPQAATPDATTPVAATPELAMTPLGRTEYYGDSKPTGDAAFAAEATMNPDYAPQSTASEPAAPSPEPTSTETQAAPAAPEQSATPAATVEATVDVEFPMTPPGRTEFYGAPAPTTTPAWAAEATMSSDDAAAPAASTNPAAASPAAGAETAAASSCREALNAELANGKITFGSGSFSVTQSSYRTLDKIAEAAKACSGVTIEVGGHTDNVGSVSGNATISDLRAKAVVTYLRRAGVDGAMLRAVGYGDAKPVAANDTPAGRRANRRIEFVVSQ